MVSKLVLFVVPIIEKRPRKQEETMEGYGAAVRHTSKGEIWFANTHTYIAIWRERGEKTFFNVFFFEVGEGQRAGKRKRIPKPQTGSMLSAPSPVRISIPQTS